MNESDLDKEYDSLESDLNQLSSNNAGSNNTADNVLAGINHIDSLDTAFDKTYNDLSTQLYQPNTVVNSFQTSVASLGFKELNKSDKKLSQVDQNIKELFNSENDLSKIFNSIPSERLLRYKTYESIYSQVDICDRMMNVFLTNIFIKNIKTDKILQLIDTPKYREKSKTEGINIKKIINTILEYFQIEKRLQEEIVPDLLKLGDFYLEIIDLSKLDAPIKEKGLKELSNTSVVYEEELFLKSLMENEQKQLSNTIKKEDKKILEEMKNFPITLDFSSLQEENYNFEEIGNDPLNNQIRQLLGIDSATILTEDETIVNKYRIEDDPSMNIFHLSNILIRSIKPHHVVEITQNGINYGYVIVESSNIVDTSSYATMVAGGSKFPENYDEREEIKKAVNNITKNIITKFSEKMPHKSNTLKLSQEAEVAFKILLYDYIKQKKSARIRFVSNEKIIPFHIGTGKYSPYGTSIFDSVVTTSKMYQLAQYAALMSRLNHASVIRKWVIDTGSMKKDHTKEVQRFVADLKNKTRTMDDLTKLETVANTITDYKDMVTISNNGRRYVDMEIMPLQDNAQLLSDLEFLRQELLASTNVPSIYLNYSDQTDLREQLVNLNVQFANRIAQIQSIINQGVNNLIDVIFQFLLSKNDFNTSYKISTFLRARLLPPLLIQLQSMEANMSSLFNVISLFASANEQLDPQIMIEKFMPTFDLEGLVEESRAALREKQLDNEANSGPGM